MFPHMPYPPMLLALARGLIASLRVSLFCRCSKGLQDYRIRPRCRTLPDMLCYSITVWYGESPPCLILLQCQQFSFHLIQILTLSATIWPHLLRFLRMPTERGRYGIDSGINATVGPLDLYAGDSGGCGSPNRIQNKSFNPLVFPLRGDTICSIGPSNESKQLFGNYTMRTRVEILKVCL